MFYITSKKWRRALLIIFSGSEKDIGHFDLVSIEFWYKSTRFYQVRSSLIQWLRYVESPNKI